MNTDYEAGSLSLTAAVAMGTGVMIGAGIFALTGQVAEYAGALFPIDRRQPADWLGLEGDRADQDSGHRQRRR